MRIVTYNVNGLRARVSSYGSLLKFLNSLEAVIICLQETKLSRQELSEDIAIAEGYEAFFSCTRTSRRGRVGYSGVVTFCRVKTVISSTEVALPLTADEGFTGLLQCSRLGATTAAASQIGDYEEMHGLECLTRQELLKLDNEGRCIITDHGHFVLFNIYGPCVQCGDSERFQFKLNFFKVLQRRWEDLLSQGRRVFVVGDLNIAPSSIDSCDPGPDFEDNLCRKWLRSLLKEGGGPFIDVFRTIHPHRKEAYTCWSQVTGSEEFNFGTRIDLILLAGPCLHQGALLEQHDILNCHIRECDILTEFKRSRPDNVPKWKGGRSVRLEGSDHAPVYIKLEDIPDIAVHDIPALAARYMPEIRGRQQSIVSLFRKRPDVGEPGGSLMSSLSSENDHAIKNCERKVNVLDDSVNRVVEAPCFSPLATNSCATSLCLNQSSLTEVSEGRHGSPAFRRQIVSVFKETKMKNVWLGCNKLVRKQTPLAQSSHTVQKRGKKANKSAQCSLRSFFSVNSSKDLRAQAERAEIEGHLQKICEPVIESEAAPDNKKRIFTAEMHREEIKELDYQTGPSCLESSPCNRNSNEGGEANDISACCSMPEKVETAQHLEAVTSNEKGKVKTAALEWQKIQDLMASSMPLCKGHGEPCVARAVKKAGPNIGRGFYVCARAKGPASNPEARCDHFEWCSKFKSRSN